VAGGICELPGNGHDVLADGATQVRVRSFCLKDLLHLGVAPGKVVDLILQLNHLPLEHALVLVEVRRTHIERAEQRARDVGDIMGSELYALYMACMTPHAVFRLK